MPTTWALTQTPYSSVKPSGIFDRLESFLPSNLSNRPPSMATMRGPGSSTKTSNGGAPREALTLPIWSMANSGASSRSMSSFFFSAGVTTAR